MNKVLRSFALVVGLPTLVAMIYFGFMASGRFVSEARFAIRSSQSEGSGGIASLLTSSSVISGGGQDSQVVVDYIQSQDMLTSLNEKLNLVAHYSDPAIDRLSRLDRESSKEDLLEYFMKHVELVEDSIGGTIVLRVDAYTREFAREVAVNVISLSEMLVNQMSRRIENDTVTRARAEVELAAEKVRLANETMTEFRSVHASINPAEETSALLGLVSNLEVQLSEVKTELSEKRAFMRETSPAVKALKNKLTALEQQLRQERGRVAGKNGDGMSHLINDYQPLALEQELAQLQYTSALTSLELSRVEADRKKRYLVTYVKPVLPDESTEPRRLMKIVTVFIYSFLFYSIGGLMWSALRDHIGH